MVNMPIHLLTILFPRPTKSFELLLMETLNRQILFFEWLDLSTFNDPDSVWQQLMLPTILRRQFMLIYWKTVARKLSYVTIMMI